MFGVVSVLPAMPRFGVAGWILVLVTVGYLVLVAPFAARRRYHRLRRDVERDPRVLDRFYRRNVARKWTWPLPPILALLLVPGLAPGHVGMAWPHGPDTDFAWVLVAEAALIIPVSALLWRRMVRRGRRVPGLRIVRPLLPRTPAQRWWAAAVSVSAGVCEEMLFRGLLIAAALAAGLPPLLAIVVTNCLFGFVHLYQGWFGIVGTGLLGSLLAWLYVTTGSLLLPVVLHTLIDLRTLLLVPAPAAPVLVSAPAAPPEPPATPSGTSAGPAAPPAIGLRAAVPEPER